MKVAIVDDENQATDMLVKYLNRFRSENHGEISIVVFHHGEQFLTDYKSDCDIVLMDIDMPGLNGIETARELRRMDNRVVLMFITNMAQYAIRGYEVEAIDFVIKPVTYQDFSMKMNKALRYVEQNCNHKITLTTGDGFVHMAVSDIYYVEVIRHYLIYHTAYGVYKVRGIMREAEEQLSRFHFIRSNNCYLVNLKYVEGLQGQTLIVGGDSLQISRSRKQDVMLRIAQYIGGAK